MELSSRYAAGEATIGGIQVLAIAEAVHALGADLRGVRSVVGVEFADLDDPWTRLPIDVARKLFAYGEQRTGDRLIGLHAGARARLRGPIAHLMASAPRLRPALALYGSFSRLAIDTSRVDLEIRGGTAGLVIALGDGTPAANRHLLDYVLMATLRMCWGRMHEGHGVREVHVRHPGRHYGDAAEMILRCPLRFGRADDRIVFPARDLDQPLNSANPLAGAQIEKGLATVPDARVDLATFAEQAEHGIHGLMMAGHRVDQPRLARRLHVSTRSLQRRLAAEGTSFRAVRDAVLRAIGEAQLWNPRLTIKEVALGLGFADVAAFSKAFRRWTGHAPSTFRRRVTSRAARRGPKKGGRGVRRS